MGCDGAITGAVAAGSRRRMGFAAESAHLVLSRRRSGRDRHRILFVTVDRCAGR